MSTNCWDYLNCSHKESCPAFPHAGRDCWHVSGTLCWGEKQGDANEKRETCLFSCKFPEKTCSGII